MQPLKEKTVILIIRNLFYKRIIQNQVWRPNMFTFDYFGGAEFNEF